MSICNETASNRKKKKREALQNHKHPDRGDRQGNKTHQTLMPKMLPLIASYSNQTLTDTVNRYLSLRKASIHVPLTGCYLLLFLRDSVRKQQVRTSRAYILTCIFAAYINTGELQHEKTAS